VQHGRQLYIYIYIIVEKVVNLSGGTGGVYPLPIIINHHENKARDIPRLHDTHTPLFYTTTSLHFLFFLVNNNNTTKPFIPFVKKGRKQKRL
jgi:hypothetical protein